MSDSFAHLHNHTEYSLLDGASKIKDLVQAAVEDGQPAMGVTDHGNMYGVLDFYAECIKQGVKPVIGNELYQAGESRFTRPKRKSKKMDDMGGEADETGEKPYYHLIALAENNEGYANLIQLSSRAFLEGYYYKPRVDWELLEEHSSGLIVTTGCLSGHVLTHLKNDDYAGALEKAARLQDIFGKDNLFVEIQNHGIHDQDRTYQYLLQIAKDLNAPLLATNDSHYVHREDAISHDALLCVQTGSLLSDEKRFKFDAHEHYIKSAHDMRLLFKDNIDACNNTLWIAERANVDIEFGKVELPSFPLPDDVSDSENYLLYLVNRGAGKRWGGRVPEEVKTRIDYELSVINSMGFADYFLIVWDLIRHAREQGIRVGPGRGSAAGCCVAYCLEITDIDPIKYDLLFERFLNPSRVSMPDIDMDFDSRFRDEMIRYTADKYGKDHVAQIVTFSRIKSRAAVRDATRVMGKPWITGDKIAKAMPPLMMGRETPLEAALSPSAPYDYQDTWPKGADLRKMHRDDPEVAEVIAVARGLEGLRRGDGIHAAAVVITKEALTNYLPIQRKPEQGQDPEDAPIVTQYEMHGVEDLGLLKMDYLALRNLDVITDTLVLLADRGVTLDIDNLELDDEKTFEMLRRGDTVGVFQLESPQMRDLLRRMAPTEFADIAAVIALYRPGPMGANMHNDYADRKNGRQSSEPFHPALAEELEETYGLMIYQESMMRVAQKLAGYSLSQADNLRKASGKKIRELMQQEREGFVQGVVGQGYDERLGHATFDIIEPFADYSFNKSHAYAYGMISYQTAYLKANHPVEYLAAILTSFRGDKKKAAIYLAEARTLGIDVTVPDVNVSTSDFTVDGEHIVFGLAGISGIGEGVAEKIMAGRADGKYAHFYDFCKKVPENVLNKKTLECLIDAGAFDSMDVPRKGLMLEFDKVVKHVKKKAKETGKGMISMFGDEDIVWEIPQVEYEKKERLTREKEMLGLYVSDHPLMGIEHAIEQNCDAKMSELDETYDSEIRTFGGVITNLNLKTTKKGDLMATFVLEDLESSCEVIVFPKTMVEYKELLSEDVVVTVKARIDARDEQFKLIMMEMTAFEGLSNEMPLRLRFSEADLTDDLITVLKIILRRHKGKAPVFFHTGEQVLRLPDEWNVDPSHKLFDDLKTLFRKKET